MERHYVSTALEDYLFLPSLYQSYFAIILNNFASNRELQYIQSFSSG